MKKLIILAIILSGCVGSRYQQSITPPPALEYSKRIKLERELARARYENKHLKTKFPRVSHIKDFPNDYKNELYREEVIKPEELVTNFNAPEVIKKDFRDLNDFSDYRMDYNGPLSLGDPGLGSSLWQEGRRGNELYRDFRAWQPMDLITIAIDENSQGIKQANTIVREESTLLAGITKLLGFETDVVEKNPNISAGDLPALLNAETTNEFRGIGDTQRRSSLTANISAMVAEVLPSGVLRIEGEKIIKVNAEEQIIVISGLVRPRDIDSRNTVNSANVAQLRIDYFGKGMLGDAQSGGWLSSLVSKIWPF